VQNGVTIDGQPGQIETGRWYDIRVEVRSQRVRCFLDGRLVHDVNYESDNQVKALYACASHDDQTGDVIVKVVNTSARPLATQLDFSGAKNLSGTGTATVLTSQNSTDENTLDKPAKVSPKTEQVDFTGTGFTRAFPGNSFTVLRLQTR